MIQREVTLDTDDAPGARPVASASTRCRGEGADPVPVPPWRPIPT